MTRPYTVRETLAAASDTPAERGRTLGRCIGWDPGD